MEKIKRKYAKRDDAMTKPKLAKCGHPSKEARYFQCEDCLPVLPSDDGDWNYFNLTEEE